MNQFFGEKATEVVFKEMKWIYNRTVFKLVKLANLNNQERKRAMEILIFLVEKGIKRARLELVQTVALKGST